MSDPRGGAWVHVVPAYRSGARAVGGVSSAALALAQIDPEHRLVVDAAGLGGLSADIAVHVHHALAAEGLKPVRRLVKTVHVLQRRQSLMRQFTEETRSERAQRAVLARADRVTVATQAARVMMLEDYPALALEEKTVVLPLVPPVQRARGPRGERPRVVAVTRFDKLKGTEDLVAAVGALLRDSAVEVVVAGGLPDHLKYQRRWLEAFERAVPETARERFSFAGWLGPEALGELLASADVMLAPSRLETYGLAVLEAMAAGCPVVATDIPAHREVAGDAALYVAGGELAEAAQAVLGAPGLADGMSERGRARVPDRLEVTKQWLHFWGQTR